MSSCNPKTDHGYLVKRAVRWLYGSKRCLAVVAEKNPGYVDEIADAIGWLPSMGSILIECKTSVSDFYSDRAKPFRRFPESGMGLTRYFLTPKGLVTDKMLLPKQWGLLEVCGKVIRQRKPAIPFGRYNKIREMRLLCSARRADNPFHEDTDSV